MSEETSPAVSEANPDAGVVPTEPKRREHYNTQFLVANFEKDERRTRLILVGVAVVIMAGIGAALVLGGGGEAKKEKPAVEGEAPVAAKPAVAPAAKPVEAAKPAAGATATPAAAAAKPVAAPAATALKK